MSGVTPMTALPARINTLLLCFIQTRVLVRLRSMQTGARASALLQSLGVIHGQ